MSGVRFLVAAIDGGGTVPPTLGVAAALVRRGHVVRVLADPTVSASARAAGCSFTPWRTAPHFESVADQTAWVTELEQGRNPRKAFAAARDRLLFGPAGDFARDVLDTLHDHPADAVLAEATVPGILIGAEAAGLPTAAMMPNIYLRPTPGLPLMGTGWSPPRSWLGRSRDRLVTRALDRLWAPSLPGLNDLRSSLSLPPVGDLYSLLDHCARVLVMTSPSFDFEAPRLPPNVRYVGPQLDDPDWALGEDWRPAGHGPLVLVAASSIFQHQADLLRRVAAALGRLPVRAVLTTGRAVEPSRIPAPANVRVVRAAPHREVLAEAGAVVTHAGHGSVLKALAAGVPLVCIPMGRDQKDNTVRVLRLGAGVRVDKNAKPATIATAVRTVIEDSSYARAARRFSETLAMEAATRPTAADEAEALLTAST